MSKLVQYVILNADILRTHNWPLGSVIAQCCHATTAVLRIYKDDDATVAYFNDIDHMHKVVLEVSCTFRLISLSTCYMNISFTFSRLRMKDNYELSVIT